MQNHRWQQSLLPIKVDENKATRQSNWSSVFLILFQTSPFYRVQILLMLFYHKFMSLILHRIWPVSEKSILITNKRNIEPFYRRRHIGEQQQVKLD